MNDDDMKELNKMLNAPKPPSDYGPEYEKRFNELMRMWFGPEHKELLDFYMGEDQ